jgi:UDP-N-acetyl-D-mannosaminuronic acid dehydrogenase
MNVPEHFEDRDVAVIGLGYVGLTLAVALADVGFRVWGIEQSATILECLT